MAARSGEIGAALGFGDGAGAELFSRTVRGRAPDV